MEQNFPIDIQLKKMTHWLESRRICNKNWHDDVSQVREKIAAAIQDMPESDQIREILSSTNINYYNCKAILQVLMETEKDSKNILGMYTSTRISDWRKVISMYEKNACYLPEASNFLSQAVHYEIPSMKRQLAKQEKNILELEKYEESTKRKISGILAARQEDCSCIGIKGEQPRKEVIEMVDKLPKLYDSWVTQSKPVLSPLIKKYVSAAGVHRDTSNCLPTLTFLLDKGNVTAYEYIHGETPLKIEEPAMLSIEDDDKADDAPICLDLDSVDLDLEAPAAIEEGDIDWGDIAVDSEEPITVDWSAVDDDDLSSQIVLEDSGTAGGVATGTDAFCILDNLRLRNLLLDELTELSSFCKMRAIELSQEKSFVLNDALSNAGDDSADSWLSSHADIVAIVDGLNTGQLHQLHQVKTSSTFVTRLVSGLQHKLEMISRLEVKIDELRLKRECAVVEVEELQKRSQRVLAKTRWLQEQLEQDVSARYNKRKVNILGGVQALTSS